MQFLTRAALVLLCLSVSPAYAQQHIPQPPPDAGQILATQIGMLVIQNASLNQQMQMQQQQIDRLRKQLADAKAAAPAPSDDPGK